MSGLICALVVFIGVQDMGSVRRLTVVPGPPGYVLITTPACPSGLAWVPMFEDFTSPKIEGP